MAQNLGENDFSATAPSSALSSEALDLFGLEISRDELLDRIVTVDNKALDLQVRYTELGIHLVEQHGFYQGRGATYRVAPADLVTILEVPEEQYGQSSD